MPSHLTRHVFRALLANEPILHHGCLRRRAYHVLRNNTACSRCVALHDARHMISSSQRRTFFSFDMFKSKRRDAEDPEMDPGVNQMMALVKRQRMRARLPPKEEIAGAFADFVDAKRRKKTAIEDTQAELLLQSLRYCANSEDSENDLAKSLISPKALYSTALVLAVSAEHSSHYHKELAQTIYELARSISAIGAHREALKTHVKYLALNGQHREARDLVLGVLGSTDHGQESSTEVLPEATEEQGTEETPDLASDESSIRDWENLKNKKLRSDCWALVLEGFARGSNESELLQTLETARQYVNSRLNPPALAMVTFYLRHGSAQQVQTWFSEYWQVSSRHAKLHGPVLGQQVHRVLQWCLQNNEPDLGHAVVRQVMAVNPPKPVWDAVFVWGSATGKGVDEIARMIQVMEDSNARLGDNQEPRLADVATINALVEFAVSRNDPYTAERFITLGRDRNIAPDARTYVLQMDYRLRVKDVDGALVSYKNLQAIDLSSNEDVPAVNRLITALCQSQRHDFDTIMNVAADLTDRQARFEPQTVATLSILHLGRDELDDVKDLLNTHAYHFSSSERDEIRDAIFAVCINAETPTPLSWDAYNLIVKFFDETPRLQRTRIMINFFERARSDMAIQVFSEMRTHAHDDVIPDLDTYVAAFVTTARTEDLEALEVIHNQLKLDFNINVNTYLNNAMMAAYSACGQPRRALEFWDDIVASKEGPTYNSIHIALRACERSPYGDQEAREIWAKLRKMKIELGQGLWASYVAALAGTGENRLAFTTIEEAETNSELTVDAFLIGSLFNSGAGQLKQQEIEEWAQSRYPHVWEELLGIGIDEDDILMRAFKIDRSVSL